MEGQYEKSGLLFTLSEATQSASVITEAPAARSHLLQTVVTSWFYIRFRVLLVRSLAEVDGSSLRHRKPNGDQRWTAFRVTSAWHKNIATPPQGIKDAELDHK